MEYPPEAAAVGLRATVRLRLVIDEFGLVAETRMADAPVIGAFATDSGDERTMQAAIEALARAALDGVRQWQYEPPMGGPVAFDVAVHFSPNSESGNESSIPRSASPPPVFQPVVALSPPGPVPDWAEGVTRVGGAVPVPPKVKHVPPVYPPEARSAAAQGTVAIDVRIEPDGHISHTRVLQSIPELDQPALDAVMQWEFSPPLVDGTPAPVLMTITIQFSTQ